MADSSKRDETITETTTGKPAVTPVAERRGEVAIDEGAETQHLQEQREEDRLEEAKAEGLRNHALEHAHDEKSYDEETSNDKK